MSIAEIILLILLLMGAYHGYKRGILKEVTGLVALGAGVILGILFIEEGKNFISRFFSTYNPILSFFSFVVIFVGVVILVNFLGRTIKSTIDFTPLGWLDNLSGGVLGLAKWMFYISMVLWVLDALEIEIQAVDKSPWYGRLHGFAPVVIQHVEDWFPFLRGSYSEVETFLESLNKN